MATGQDSRFDASERREASASTGTAAEANRSYYEALSPGRIDYWQKMAAPRRRVAVFRDLIDELQPQALVDLGCGDGSLLAEFARAARVQRLAGIDLSAPQIEANRRRHTGIDWSSCDLTVPDSIPGAMLGRFDVVVASEIIEHVDEPARFLEAAHALAVPGEGTLLLSTQSGPVRETERRVGHIRHFDVGALEDLLRASGWQPRRVWNEGFPFHDASKWWANRNPDASMARFGGEAYGLYERAVCFALRQAFRVNSRRRGAQLFAVATRQ